MSCPLFIQEDRGGQGKGRKGTNGGLHICPEKGSDSCPLFLQEGRGGRGMAQGGQERDMNHVPKMDIRLIPFFQKGTGEDRGSNKTEPLWGYEVFDAVLINLPFEYIWEKMTGIFLSVLLVHVILLHPLIDL